MKCPFELPVELRFTDLMELLSDSDNAKYIFQAINSHEKYETVLRKIADQANRATMVQDRSVGIIKGVCGVIFSEAKQALKEAGE